MTCLLAAFAERTVRFIEEDSDDAASVGASPQQSGLEADAYSDPDTSAASDDEGCQVSTRSGVVQRSTTTYQGASMSRLHDRLSIASHI
jgi:hypothetical protein